MISLDFEHLLIHFLGSLSFTLLLMNDTEVEHSDWVGLLLNCLLQVPNSSSCIFFALVNQESIVKITFEIIRIDVKRPLIESGALLKVVDALLQADVLLAGGRAVQSVNVVSIHLQDLIVDSFLYLKIK
jgi:hypothetical protein